LRIGAAGLSHGDGPYTKKCLLTITSRIKSTRMVAVEVNPPYPATALMFSPPKNNLEQRMIHPRVQLVSLSIFLEIGAFSFLPSTVQALAKTQKHADRHAETVDYAA
jgi:hypothetical protein